MSLFSMSFAGGALILIGTWESLTSSTSSSPPKTHRFSTVTLLSASFLSLCFILNSLLSFSLSSDSKLGPTLQLPVLAVSCLFFLFSLLGLASNKLGPTRRPLFPYPLLNSLLLFCFVEEFLLFYLKLKRGSGIEDRYYDLMLVPILLTMITTMVELNGGGVGVGVGEGVNYAKLGRGLGLVLQGSWFVQMGWSFFSDMVANNCDLRRVSRGEFSVQCKSHMDAHRGGAIAVLLFNCHLAVIVAVVCLVYAVVGGRRGGGVVRNGGDSRSYRPIGGGVGVVGDGKFTLDSDSDDGGGVEEIKVEEGNSGSRRGNGSVELVGNGHGSHH